jgi:hypothetical protein
MGSLNLLKEVFELFGFDYMQGYTQPGLVEDEASQFYIWGWYIGYGGRNLELVVGKSILCSYDAVKREAVEMGYADALAERENV